MRNGAKTLRIWPRETWQNLSQVPPLTVLKSGAAQLRQRRYDADTFVKLV